MPEKTARPKMDPKFEEAREHMRAAHENMHKVIESMIPEGVRENRKAARREFLLGLRSLVDAALERSDTTAK
jgi:hypothetical protein